MFLATPLRVALAVWIVISACLGVVLASTFIPTSSIVCEHRSGEERCEQKIRVMGFIDDSVDFEIQFTLDGDTQMTDKDGRKWAPASPVTVQIKRQHTRYVFELTPASSFLNAYQKQTAMPGLLFPPGDTATEKYCVGKSGVVKNELEHNSTAYNSYDVQNGRIQFQLDVQAKQGSTVRTVSLSQSKNSDTLPGISATIAMDVSLPAIITGHRQVVEQSAEAILSQGFIVESSFFSPSKLTNSLGIKKEDWASAFTCSQSYGYLVQVNGHMYNQVGSFVNNRLVDMLPDCTFDVTQSAYASTSSYPRLSYLCQGIATTIIVLELSAGASTFKLKKLFGEPMILESGVLPFTTSETSAYLYVDIMNKGDSSGSFSVQVTQCCVKPQSEVAHNCDAFPLPDSVSATVEAISTSRFRILLPALPVTNKVGYCDVRVMQHGREELVSRIGFDTTKFYQTKEIDDENQCHSPNIAYVHNGKQYCRPPCATTDQEFDQVKKACVPIDCHSKYAGIRDFFNTETNYCETKAVCTSNEIYDSLTNQCMASKNSTSNGEIVDEREYLRRAEENMEKIVTPNCGDHGNLSEDKTTCICDPGWTTNIFRGSDGNTFCTTPEYGRNSESNHTDPYTLANKGEDFLYGVLKMLSSMSPEVQIFLVVVVFFAACILLGVCGCVCFCGCQFTKGAGLAKAPAWAIKAAVRHHRNSRIKKKHAPMTNTAKLAWLFGKAKDVFLYGAQGLHDNADRDRFPSEIPDFIIMQQRYMHAMQQQYMEHMRYKRAMASLSFGEDRLSRIREKRSRQMHRRLKSVFETSEMNGIDIDEGHNREQCDGISSMSDDDSNRTEDSMSIQSSREHPKVGRTVRLQPDVNLAGVFG